jgi:two-component system nitrate/nitrite response regulator NarL
MSPQRPLVTVLVADDHPLYREALARAVVRDPRLSLVGEAGDGAEALELIERLEPDVAVLDVRLPDVSAIVVLESLAKARLGTRVVLVSGYAEDDVVFEAVASGASAYFPKTTDATEICDGVMTAADGGMVLPPEIQARIVREIRARRDDPRPGLTERELEILRLAARGRPGPRIAAELGVSPGTVKTHMRHIFEKLAVPDRASAVAEAMRRGLLA